MKTTEEHGVFNTKISLLRETPWLNSFFIFKMYDKTYDKMSYTSKNNIAQIPVRADSRIDSTASKSPVLRNFETGNFPH